jgi:3-methylcrotonyl-CoA carboxylase alpha subunit
LRIDTGVREGDEVTVHYDPMLAKLIVWGESRNEAVGALRAALAGCEVAGVATNLDFLHSIVSLPDFRAGKIHTGFIPQHHRQLFAAPDAASRRQGIVLAAIAFLQAERNQAAARDEASSPWSAADGWRLNSRAAFGFQLHDPSADEPIGIRIDGLELAPPPGTICAAEVSVDGTRVAVSDVTLAPGRIRARLDGKPVEAGWRMEGQRGYVFLAGRTSLLARTADRDALRSAADAGGLKSPMPGQVIQVLVEPGAQVRRGQPLMIVEAMKMEHTILAPGDGIVETVGFATGDRVEEGAQLLRLKSVAGASGSGT